MCEKINVSEIKKYLSTDFFNIHIFDVLPSTNTALKTAAENGAPEHTVYIADSQTSGRGRFGKSFFSQAGSGIYMSLLLKPTTDIADSLLITIAAAVACAAALAAVSGKKTYIKWVNDIYIDNKKVCGILTESALEQNNHNIRYTVLGIGINVFTKESDFPDDIKNKAGSVFDSIPEKYIREKTIANILTSFFELYPNMNKNDLLNRYRKLSFLNGKKVEILSGDAVEEAKVIGINDDFSLRVMTCGGTEKNLYSGDVSLKLK